MNINLLLLTSNHCNSSLNSLKPMQKSNYILVSSCEQLQNFTIFIKKNRIKHNPYFIQSTITQYHINFSDTLNFCFI